MGDSEGAPPVAKRPKLAEVEDEGDAAMAKIFLQLDGVHDKLMQHQEDVERKVAMLRVKMREAAKPLYDERRRLAAKIPGFWRKALQGHPTIGQILTSLDRKILAYLIEIVVEESVDPRDDWYSIIFSFEENPFFENANIWKKFSTKMVEGESKTIVTTSGVNFKSDKKGEVRRDETILNWFQPDDHDTELGEVFRTDIWQHPLVTDAYGNGDGDDETDSHATGSNRGEKEAQTMPSSDDVDQALAIAAAWADSDSE